MQWRKLRDIEAVAPNLMEELRSERAKGASYVQLAVMVYDRTRIIVDPTTVRAWFLAQREEEAVKKEEPSAERVVKQNKPSAEVSQQSTSTGRVRVRYRG